MIADEETEAPDDGGLPQSQEIGVGDAFEDQASGPRVKDLSPPGSPFGVPQDVLEDQLSDVGELGAPLDPDVETPGVQIHGQEEGFPWGDQFTFGLKDNCDGSITVYNARAIRHDDPLNPTGVILGAAAANTITFGKVAAHQLICWQWVKGSALITVMRNPQDVQPNDDAYNVYGTVADFAVTNPSGDDKTFVVALNAGGAIQCGSPAIIDPWAPMPVSPNNQNLVAGTDATGKTQWWGTWQLVSWS
jgi:hypothetical protein